MNQPQMKLFESEEFGKVRTAVVDGTLYFVGVDIAQVLGYSNPSKAVLDHCKGVSKLGIPSAGGTQLTNVIPEGDVYRLVVKAADQSRNFGISLRAEAFEKWIFEDVVPSVRRTGMYATDELLANPDLLIAAATELKRERAERQRLEQQVESDRPKVIFAEALETSGSSILIGELARLLKQNGVEIGQNRLFKMLRQDGYLGRRGEYYNMPTQRAMELKLFEIKTRTINNPDGSVRTTRTTKVTGKGQSYFINKYREAVG